MPRDDTLPSRVPCVCDRCGATFVVWRSRFLHDHPRFCSKACTHATYLWSSDEERFWARVEKSTGCWLWTGAQQYYGYGELSVGKNRHVRAHRYSYQLAYGPIPKGLVVCHRCDNPPCVRPDHLFLGTHRQNVLDKLGKRRHTWGDGHPNTRLSEAQVAEIRRRYAEGGISQGQLGRDYGVHGSTINAIVLWKTRLGSW